MTARVLIVDDVMPNLRLLKAKLDREYFEVITASSGQEALEKVEREQPDIILLDVMMPDMDGLEVCRRIKKNPETAYLPVVLVTAIDQPQGVEVVLGRLGQLQHDLLALGQPVQMGQDPLAQDCLG
ncbi:MAG: response regulator, partial [Pseudomonadota bacterium]